MHFQSIRASAEALPAYDEQQEKFPESLTYQDKGWAFGYFAQFAIIIGIAISFSKVSNTDSDIDEEDLSDNAIFGVLSTYILSGVAASVIWIFTMSQFTTILVWATLLSCGIVSGILGILFLQSNTTAGMIFLLIFVINCIYVYYVRHRVAFTIAIVEVAIEILKLFPHTLTVSFVSLLVHLAWMIIWMIALVTVLLSSDQLSDNLLSALEFFLFLSFFWNSQVVSNVVFVTVSGVCGDWYYNHPDHMKPACVSRALKHACTVSFGSICFGSFVLAFVKTLRTIMNSLRRKNKGVGACLAGCFMKCIEDVLEYVNTYAFCYVAIYRKSYCQAAKSVWELFKYHGWDIVINDDLTGGLIVLGAIFNGAVVACISYFVGTSLTENAEVVGTIAVLGFFIGITMGLCSLGVIQATVATILVCYCEDPVALNQTKPELYNKLTEAFTKRYGDKVDVPV